MRRVISAGAHAQALYYSKLDILFDLYSVGKLKSIDTAGSKIPVPSSPSPSKKSTQSDAKKASARSTPTNSAPGTPMKSGQTPTIGTPKTDTSVPGDVLPSRLSGGRPQSLPWESVQVHSDDESQVGTLTSEFAKRNNWIKR